MIERCSSCLGKKTIIGLGGIVKDCPKCDGIGYVNNNNEYKNYIIQDNIGKTINYDLPECFIDSNTNKSPKRGRPKKINNVNIDKKFRNSII